VLTALTLAGVAVASAGCGHSSTVPAKEQQLQRADLVAVSRALGEAEPTVRDEVTASRGAWPLVANGLPAQADASARAQIALAAKRSSSVNVPAVLGEREARSLTGPASSIAGSFRVYTGLASRGWGMIAAALDEAQRGTAASAGFTRANSPLYIESVYDAHYSLGRIGKRLATEYGKLGGAGAFGASLTPAQVRALARAYYEPANRLHPHPGVRLGT
jgi:hypothetical protein